jgi:hypothetical protein
LFKYDFKNFSRTTFNRLDLKELLCLRAVLRCGGVFVKPNSHELTIAQSLVNLVQEEEQYIWSAADIDEARADLQKGPITSGFISLRGNRRLQLPGQPLTSAYLRHLAELERFHRAHKALPIRALPITEALPIEALPVDTNESALPVDTDTNEPPKPDSFTFEALLLETHEPVDTDDPLETDERNQLAVPSANATESSMEGIFTLEIDERAEPSVEDALTFNTLTSPPLPLSSIPGTGFGQFHTLQRTNGNTTSTYTLTEFEFQASQRTGVG